MLISFIIACILLVILLISYFKFNTFLVLFGVSVLLGLLVGMDVDLLIKTIKAGFGHTLEKIGLLIIFGIILGEILEKTGAIQSIAASILKMVGPQNSEIAILLIGFIVGLPIFCDSGFIILSGLIFSFNQPAKKMSFTIALAGALYAVHCLVPPHPGISVATTKLGIDVGLTMILGIFLAIPATIVAYFWAKFSNKKFTQNIDNQPVNLDYFKTEENKFSAAQAFLPLWLPIFLMGLKAIALLATSQLNANVLTAFKFVGEPMIALLIGIISAWPLLRNNKAISFNSICNESFSKSGHILAIIAAGGIFGEIVKETLAKIDTSQLQLELGIFWIWVPFLLTFFFKTAQGSSTVAIMSATAILLPLLPQLGIDTAAEKQLTLFAMGAGSMMISHANDAYFWVVSNFAKQDASLSFKTYTPMSVLMGLCTITILWLVSIFVHF
jgi:gluconate:H+ symporter, GntP family